MARIAEAEQRQRQREQRRRDEEEYRRREATRAKMAAEKPRWERIVGNRLVGVAILGDSLVIDGIRWKVIAARDLGSVLRSRLVKPQKTPGRFIFVEFEVENLRKDPATFFERDLYDKNGRRYNTISDAMWYFDRNTVFILENINPNVPLRFVQVYEVPKDASDLFATVSNLRILGRQVGAISIGF
ncbi:MAG: DUF4352 domain-containing protein [Planctomycetes bacterium]|nr:DUF4352 domain-containing protein [Planctomycetota bacterium]